jgi:hypothetical protein
MLKKKGKIQAVKQNTSFVTVGDQGSKLEGRRTVGRALPPSKYVSRHPSKYFQENLANAAFSSLF